MEAPRLAGDQRAGTYRLRSLTATQTPGRIFAALFRRLGKIGLRRPGKPAVADVIGIGASAGCDGQILVTDDMLGLFDWTPKFVRRYADLRGEIDRAVGAYADDVRGRRFPGAAETYFSKAAE